MRHLTPVSVLGALAFTAGVVGEVVSRFARPARWRRHRKASPARWLTPISLRQAIFGHTKSDVALLLGPPRAALMGATVSTAPTFWTANTWYYPFDRRRQTAVAVQFNHDRVVRVEFIGAAS